MDDMVATQDCTVFLLASGRSGASTPDSLATLVWGPGHRGKRFSCDSIKAFNKVGRPQRPAPLSMPINGFPFLVSGSRQVGGPIDTGRGNTSYQDTQPKLAT